MPPRTAPIFGFNAARDAIVHTVVDRVVDSTADPLLTLNDAAYHEIKRLEASSRPADVEALAGWRKLARGLSKMSDRERRVALRERASYYGWDIAGNFDERVFQVSTRLLPAIVTALIAPGKLASLARSPSRLVSLDTLSDKVRIEGPVERIRRLVERGTAVYVPTHLSNLDSIVFGYALERAGLPPATYGAGKNLFTNPVLSFFMRNLGAYRVDRRIKHQLYKDMLKTYSCVLLEHGYHSLFFPGGTRSRSGGVEQRLKLGLVGSAIEGYARTLMAGRERRVYFVPATINYLVTLEAETLIADFLSDSGRGRYIIEDDESSRIGRVAAFMRKMLGMNGAVVIRFSDPIDPFGNVVDDDGRSRDRRGREIDPASYVKDTSGKVCLDAARDAQYTRELGEAICEAYARDTVLQCTHIVAAVCFARLRDAARGGDLYTILRQRDVIVPRDELAHDTVKLRDELAAREARGELRLGDIARRASGGDMVERALRAFHDFHPTPSLVSSEDGIRLMDPNLLFYYQNRLAGYGLGWDPHQAKPRHGGAE